MATRYKKGHNSTRHPERSEGSPDCSADLVHDSNQYRAKSWRSFTAFRMTWGGAKGQTLIEVLVSLVFITAGALALIRFQSYLAYNTTLINQKAEATLLAVSKIESLRDFQVLNNIAGYTSYQSIASASATSTGKDTVYTITWTVTPFTDPTYKNISVVVSWADRYGNSQSIRQVTYVAGIDPQNSSVIM